MLDKAHARHPTMVLIHGGSGRGTEHIAALWATDRKIPQVPFKPDFAKHSRAAAPFMRNDRVIATMPRGIIIFPGGGIQDNLFDKARIAGIAIIDHRRR